MERICVFFKTLAIAATLVAGQAQSQSCGGDFGGFVGGLKSEAVSMGYDRGLVDRFFANVQRDQAVINADRRQGIFQRPFLDFFARADFAEPAEQRHPQL